jgi:hypothetical protein
MSWSLGFDLEGETEALIFDAEISKIEMNLCLIICQRLR